MGSIAAIKSRKKRQRAYADIPMDPELVGRLEALRERIAAAAADTSGGWKSELPQLQEELAALEEEAKTATQRFWFESTGRKAYSRLLDEYPPRKGNRVDSQVGFNADEFPPALMATCAVDPKMSFEEASEIWDEWSDAETTELFEAARRANKEILDVPFFSNGSGPATEISGKGGSTPPTTESPTPNS